MNYYVYYDTGTKKVIKSFGDDKDSACSFFRNLLDEDPYSRLTHCYEFIPLVWDRPDLYDGPVLVMCNAETEKSNYYYNEVQDFLALVEKEKTYSGPWYSKDYEFIME